MSTQRYSVTPHPIETLLTWVKSGEIAIPEIQRPFVWEATQVRNLLDSLYQGYPVGYLIAWRNPTVKLKDGSTSAGNRILIDGQDIAAVTQDSLRAQVGMVTQDTSLLHRSVRDNILYGRPDADDAQMIAAARRAEAVAAVLLAETRVALGDRGRLVVRRRRGYALVDVVVRRTSCAQAHERLVRRDAREPRRETQRRRERRQRAVRGVVLVRCVLVGEREGRRVAGGQLLGGPEVVRADEAEGGVRRPRSHVIVRELEGSHLHAGVRGR